MKTRIGNGLFGRIGAGIRCLSLFAVLLAFGRVAYSQEVHLRLATTSSPEDSGLLNVLLPPFEKKNNCKVDVISVGTGKALKIAENGDADVVLVHARKLEDKFVADGFGVDRRDVMYDDFIIVGPQDDPAGIKGEKDAASALKKIAEKGSPFVSRGDESGTHIREKELWAAAGVTQKGPWYMEAGQEMGATLIMGNEKLAYVLTDRGTYTAFKNKLQLKLICEGDPRFYNPYGVIAVNPKKWPHVKFDLARAFIEFITTEEGQTIIANFRKDGEQLFHPDAVKIPRAQPK